MKEPLQSNGQGMSIRQVAIASMAGTILEWYDFFLYGFVAALVFGELYFPTYSPLVGTLASFGTLAVGFIARPLGGLLFGHFGDRIGRKAMLITTLSVMGGASFLIGLIPSYQSIGVLAPIILTVLRFLQGIGLGGELGGAIAMTIEHSPRQQRGFYGSVVALGSPLGLALATSILFGSSFLLSKESFLSWGWRIAFLINFVLLGIGLYIRLNLEETPAFKKLQERGGVVRFPILLVMRQYYREVLCAIALYLGGITVPFYTVWVFLTYYATSALHLDRSLVLLGVMGANIVLLASTLAGGYFSDKIGRKPICFISLLFNALLAFPLFWIVDLGQIFWLWLVMLVFGIPQWLIWGAVPVLYCELFPTHLRYTGVAIGSQAATIIGGFVPLFATAVVPKAGTWPISVLIVVCALIGISSLFYIKETAPALSGDGDALGLFQRARESNPAVTPELG
jgi:MFS family permease